MRQLNCRCLIKSNGLPDSRQMNLCQITRLYHTVKHLKFTQVYHQMKYRLVRARRPTQFINGEFVLHNLVSSPAKAQAFVEREGSWQFRFLKLEKSFDVHNINWSFDGHGLLWTYNLNYFDWLHQKDMTPEFGLNMLGAFYSAVDQNPIALHPYPTSLRIINVSKFVCKWNAQESWLYDQIVADLGLLQSRLEYHLLANHLLENAFALYIGGMTTGRSDMLDAGRKLLAEQLQEQILDDGMHYERSPMYHMIILERLLDALNFAKAKDDELVELLTVYAIKMTSLAMNWRGLERIPMMQDSAFGVAPHLNSILGYAERLLLEAMPRTPGEFGQSRYRTLTSGSLMLVANVGSIRPSYQPGHAHADELNFELFHNGRPVITDVGVSTYEKNERRHLERSTASHNCLYWGNNSSDVWSGFRVGRRAKVDLLQDTESKILAQHDGHSQGLVSRCFESIGKKCIAIADTVRFQKSPGVPGTGKLHLHPDVSVVKLSEHEVLLSSDVKITFYTGKSSKPKIQLGTYECAQGYNTLAEGVFISYSVTDEMTIQFNDVS